MTAVESPVATCSRLPSGPTGPTSTAARGRVSSITSGTAFRAGGSWSGRLCLRVRLADATGSLYLFSTAEARGPSGKAEGLAKVTYGLRPIAAPNTKPRLASRSSGQVAKVTKSACATATARITKTRSEAKTIAEDSKAFFANGRRGERGRAGRNGVQENRQLVSRKDFGTTVFRNPTRFKGLTRGRGLPTSDARSCCCPSNVRWRPAIVYFFFHFVPLLSSTDEEIY